MLGVSNILVALAFATSALASPIVKRATGVYIKPGNNDLDVSTPSIALNEPYS